MKHRKNAGRICRVLLPAAFAASVLYGGANVLSILRADHGTGFPWYAAYLLVL